MFQAGDYVVYGSGGVCRVEEICLPPFAKAMKGTDYYRLTPVYDNGTIYVPVNADVYMRPVMSREQALALIDGIPDVHARETEGCDARQNVNEYRAAIGSHDCEELLRLIKTVYQKNESTVARGKKPGETDQMYMDKAKGLLHGELAISLGIPIEEVEDFINVRVAAK